MIDFYMIRYFMAVVERGTFSKAASQVNVSQPSLSVGIAKLEAALKTKLFLRSNRRIQLTEAGSRFLVRAQNIMREYTAALGETGSAEASQPLRVGVLETIPASVLENTVIQYRLFGDGPVIEILEGTKSELARKLDQGRLHAILTILDPEKEDAVFTRICTEGYSLAVSADHPLASAKDVAGDALRNETMIVRRHCEILSETSRYFTARNVRPFFSLRTRNDEKALSLVRCGLGVTVMPDSYRDPGIRRVRLKGFKPKRAIGVCTLTKSAALEAAAQRFSDAARLSFHQALSMDAP